MKKKGESISVLHLKLTQIVNQLYLNFFFFFFKKGRGGRKDWSYDLDLETPATIKMKTDKRAAE